MEDEGSEKPPEYSLYLTPSFSKIQFYIFVPSSSAFRSKFGMHALFLQCSPIA